jgi:hypothetical protein
VIRRGVDDRNAGDPIAYRPAHTDVRTYSTHSCGREARAFTASMTEVAAIAESVYSRRRRRSAASAMAPPTRDSASRGTSSHNPRSPTANAEPVSSNTWNGTATKVICVPRNETVLPSHRNRKSRDVRSGVTSRRLRSDGGRGGTARRCCRWITHGGGMLGRVELDRNVLLRAV